MKGATPEDQDGVDDAVIGMCAAKAYTPEECRRHQLLTSNKPAEEPKPRNPIGRLFGAGV